MRRQGLCLLPAILGLPRADPSACVAMCLAGECSSMGSCAGVGSCAMVGACASTASPAEGHTGWEVGDGAVGEAASSPRNLPRRNQMCSSCHHCFNEL